MSNKIKKKEFKQIENQAQEGRSMIEMLGVLAVIGVLSIGGIAGYRWGMDKHVSNQILYEMNLNSAQLAMLLQKGNPEGVTLSLGSPYDDGKFRTVDYGFEYACGEEASFGHDCKFIDETIYSMTATGLPKRVCNMLGDAVFGMAYYYDSEINGGDNECNDTGNTVTVFFDTDTTVEGGIPRPEESETHTPAPEVTEAVTSTTTATTESTTPETTTTEATIYTSSATYSSTEATTYTSSSTYTPTSFVSTTIEPECTSNDDCEEGEFCSSGVDNKCEYKCTNNQMTEAESCAGKTYRCESIGSPSSKKINGTTYYYKEAYMNWWSANRYCQALKAKGLVEHGTLVSLEELGCEKPGPGNTGYCDSELLNALYATNSCKKGESCPSFSSEVWTSTPYDSKSENSCGMLGIFLSPDWPSSNHSIGSTSTDYDSNAVLCE